MLQNACKECGTGLVKARQVHAYKSGRIQGQIFIYGAKPYAWKARVMRPIKLLLQCKSFKIGKPGKIPRKYHVPKSTRTISRSSYGFATPKARYDTAFYKGRRNKAARLLLKMKLRSFWYFKVPAERKNFGNFEMAIL